jgi:hypothetical protein
MLTGMAGAQNSQSPVEAGCGGDGSDMGLATANCELNRVRFLTWRQVWRGAEWHRSVALARNCRPAGMSGSRMAFMEEHRQAVANNIVSWDGCLEKPLLNQSRQIWPKRESSLTEQPAELLMRIVHLILRSDPPRWRTVCSVQQGSHLRSSVVYFNLQHRIARLEFVAGFFGGFHRVKLRLEMAVNNHHKSFGRRPVGTRRLPLLGFVK